MYFRVFIEPGTIMWGLKKNTWKYQWILAHEFIFMNNNNKILATLMIPLVVEEMIEALSLLTVSVPDQPVRQTPKICIKIPNWQRRVWPPIREKFCGYLLLFAAVTNGLGPEEPSPEPGAVTHGHTSCKSAKKKTPKLVAFVDHDLDLSLSLEVGM